jgi:hypothetical protein
MEKDLELPNLETGEYPANAATDTQASHREDVS